MLNKKLLSVGEILWDCIGESRNDAGAPYTFAKQLNAFDVETWLVSAVGEDVSGLELEAAVNKSGIRVEIQKNSLQTGFARVCSCNGKNAFELAEPAAWDRIELNERLKGLSEKTDALYFGSLAQRNDVTRRTIRALAESFSGRKRFCDINLRSPFDNDEIVEWCIHHCEVLKLSDDETMRVAQVLKCDKDEIVSVCFEHTGIEILVETLGAQGARAWRSNGEFVYFPAPSVDVVSTVGAGDAFFAAFAAKILANASLADALKTAVNHAAKVISFDSTK